MIILHNEFVYHSAIPWAVFVGDRWLYQVREMADPRTKSRTVGLGRL